MMLHDSDFDRIAPDLARCRVSREAYMRATPDAASPVLFFKVGDSYRAYQFDAYLIAGLAEIEPVIMDVHDEDTGRKYLLALVNVHEMLIETVCAQLVGAGRSLVFQLGEEPHFQSPQLREGLCHVHVPPELD